MQQDPQTLSPPSFTYTRSDAGRCSAAEAREHGCVKSSRRSARTDCCLSWREPRAALADKRTVAGETGSSGPSTTSTRTFRSRSPSRRPSCGASLGRRLDPVDRRRLDNQHGEGGSARTQDPHRRSTHDPCRIADGPNLGYDEDGQKVAGDSLQLVRSLVGDDPELTVSLSQPMTAASAASAHDRAPPRDRVRRTCAPWTASASTPAGPRQARANRREHTP